MIAQGDNEPTLTQALRASFSNMISEIHTILPGKIDSYDRTKHKAEIQPMLKKKFKNETEIRLPVLVNVPVVWPRTQEGSFSFPLKSGDGVLIVFSERSMEEFLSLGRELPPSDPRKFDLTDAIAIPGLFSFADDVLETSTTDMELIFNNSSLTFKEGGDIVVKGGNTITIKSNGDIEIGSSSLKKLVNENFQTMFNSHIHNVSVAGTPAAQAGTSSSPVKGVGPITISVPAVPTTLLGFGEAISANELTSKTKAE